MESVTAEALDTLLLLVAKISSDGLLEGTPEKKNTNTSSSSCKSDFYLIRVFATVSKC